MIVLDEQLQGLGLEHAVSRWYRGAVVVVTTLRPGTVVKDEAIPTLLRRCKQPIFVTINHTDFWRRIPADRSYCIVCLALTIEQAAQVGDWLRRLCRLPEFKTKRTRMGKVVLLSQWRLQYYHIHATPITTLRWLTAE